MTLREEIAELIGQRWPAGHSAASIADEIVELVGEKGLRIVPVEPTDNMLVAAHNPTYHYSRPMTTVYAAMLAASPDYMEKDDE